MRLSKDIALALLIIAGITLGVGAMKERNFERSPLSSREFSMMIIGVSNEMLHTYESWLAEEMNRRGIDSKFDDLTLAYMKGLEDGKAAK